jgi:hypothetical protein
LYVGITVPEGQRWHLRTATENSQYTEEEIAHMTENMDKPTVGNGKPESRCAHIVDHSSKPTSN